MRSGFLAVTLLACGCANKATTQAVDLDGREVTWVGPLDALWDVIHDHPRVFVTEIQCVGDGDAQREFVRLSPTSKESVRFGITFRGQVADDSAWNRFRESLKTDPVLAQRMPVIILAPESSAQRIPPRDDAAMLSFTVALFSPRAR